MDTAKRFGRTIKALRKQKGLTQAQLAELTERSVDAISQIERGVNLPSFETLDRLSAALGVPVKEFFEDQDVDAEQAELLATASVLLRNLSQQDLKIAVEQLRALAERR